MIMIIQFSLHKVIVVDIQISIVHLHHMLLLWIMNGLFLALRTLECHSFNLCLNPWAWAVSSRNGCGSDIFLYFRRCVYYTDWRMADHGRCKLIRSIKCGQRCWKACEIISRHLSFQLVHCHSGKLLLEY